MSQELAGAKVGASQALTDAKGRLSSWWKSKATGSFLEVGGSAGDEARKQAAVLMRKRGLANCEKAMELLRQVHAQQPDDLELKLELADAINAVMRIKTHANTIVLEGTVDSPAYKKIWRTLGNEALPLAKEAYTAMPTNVRALSIYADSFMFECSSKDIVKQALSGAGKEYKRICKELLKYPKHDSGVGYALMGAFYNVAPWPVGSKKSAAKYFDEGAKLAPSRRNLYYVGVNAYQTGDYERAKDFFTRAIAAPCGSPTEEDFGEFMLQEARRGLKQAEEALVQAKA